MSYAETDVFKKLSRELKIFVNIIFQLLPRGKGLYPI